MLSVSQDWKDMFSKNFLNEALIKFVVEDYGTLYKGDIFSYTFNGKVSAIGNEYPTFKARLKLVMRDDYVNITNFIGKSVEIYYGFIINGSDEYVKALTLYIDNVEFSDDGRVCYWNLVSLFAKLTDTISLKLYEQIGGGSISFTNTFSQFLSSQLTSYSYIKENGTYNYNVRFLPSRITLGNALQELSFVNGGALTLNSNNDIVIASRSVLTASYTFDKINVLGYPHIEKMEHPANVEVYWLDIDNPANYSSGNVCEELMNIVRITQGVYRGSIDKYYENDSCFIDWNICLRNDYNSGVSINNENLYVYNNHIEVQNTASGDVYYEFSINGYQFNNFFTTESGKVSIFDININNVQQKQNIDSWVELYLQSQKTIEFECRIDPSYEMLDSFVFSNSVAIFMIEEMTITFNGGYSGKIKGRYDNNFRKPLVSNFKFETTTFGQITTTTASFEIINPNVVALPIIFYADDTPFEPTGFPATIPIAGHPTYSESQGSLSTAGQFFQYAEQKDNGALDKDIYVAFKIGDKISEKTLVIEKDT